MTELNFDARNVDPQQTFEPLPAGWYNFMIVESEMRPTRNQDGSYLQFTLKVVDGEYAGRQVFDRMNLQNPNPVASEIGYRRLSAYCHATGVIQLQNSQQLHGIPFKARVNVRTDSTGQYDPSNEVKGVKHINDNEGGTTAPPQSQASPQQPSWQPPQQPASQPQASSPPQAQAPAQPQAQAPAPAPQQQAPAWNPPSPPQQTPQAAGPVPPWAQASQ